MEAVFLSEPNKVYQKSFEDYVLAYKQVNDDDYFDLYKMALENFDEYLRYLNNYSLGINLPDGYGATSNFWLIDNGEVVGVVRIRHYGDEFSGHIGYDISPYHRKKGYGNQILKLALVKAALIGIEEAILTCLLDNKYSIKVIKNNNGELLGEIFDEIENEHLFKYRIPTDSLKY